MIVTEYSTDTAQPLLGSVDGTNCLFAVHFAMNLDYVTVLINGTPIAPDVDNGWSIVDAYTVRMKEAPLATDTVAVEYATGAVKGGGGAGGAAGTGTLISAMETRPETLVTVGNDAPQTQTACICLDCEPD